jgi:hypothetical protein
MKLTRNMRICQADSGHMLARRLFVLALVALVAVQTATIAFSQEEVPPSPSTQQSSAPSDPMKSQVLQIPHGSFVEVRLISGEKLRGRLGDILDEGFMLRTVSNNRLVDLQVRFEELRSVRPVSNPQTPDRAFDKNLRRSRQIMGLVVAGITVVLVAVAVSQAR